MLDKIFNRILLYLAVVAAALILYITVTVDFEVISRYGFNRPTRWVVDYSEYALIYILFLASAWVLSEEGHVRIDIVLNLISNRARHILNAISSLLATVACGIFTWYGAKVTLDAYLASAKIWQSMIVPTWAVWIVIPFGGLLLTLQFLRRTWHYTRAARRSG